MPLSPDAAGKLYSLAEAAGDTLVTLTDTLDGLATGRLGDEATTAARCELVDLAAMVAGLFGKAKAAGLIDFELVGSLDVPEVG